MCSEIVIDGITGFVVHTYAPHALYEKNKLIIDDEKIWINLSSTSRDRVIKSFNLNKRIAQYIEMYHQRLGKKHLYCLLRSDIITHINRWKFYFLLTVK